MPIPPTTLQKGVYAYIFNQRGLMDPRGNHGAESTTCSTQVRVRVLGTFLTVGKPNCYTDSRGTDRIGGRCRRSPVSLVFEDGGLSDACHCGSSVEPAVHGVTVTSVDP